jgi:methylmalonyl-CoA mutase
VGDDVIAGFPAVSRADWEARAGDLERLRTTTYDGIVVEPLYTASDGHGDGDGGLPGFAPFSRGRTAGGTRRGWDVRQVVDAAAPAGRAVEELERGATSIWLELRHADTDGVDAALDRALDGVLIDVAPVVLAAGGRWPEAAASLARRWERGAVAPAPGGSLGADPLGSWASARSAVDPDAELAAAAEWAKRLADGAPGVRTFTVDGMRYHDAGASDGQELGITAAAAVETLRALDGVDDPFAAVELRLVATGDQFATIAKLRAARRLWARIADVAGDPTAAARTTLHAVTSTAMMTRRDPAVNALRATVACFAAAVAGADAITVLPYDAFSAAEPSERARRLARNTQAVLAMESHLAAVIDPAGGAWYVERLTADVAEAAWAVVQEIEAAGGFRAAVESGLVGERIAAVGAVRDADVDHRRLSLVGLSAHPDLGEPPPVADAIIQTAADGSLPRHRWGERFEVLRAGVDAHAARTGRRPHVYLATLGQPAEFTAAVTRARGLFEVAGLETVTGPADGFAASAAEVACVCASDARLADEGDSAVAALDAAGARRVYISGRDELAAGGDARTVLADLLDALRIAA